jgi:hypothetical protein
MAQLQHNMWVANAKTAALSVITGGGKWVEITVSADSLYQHLLLTAEKKFWRCVESGEPLVSYHRTRPFVGRMDVVRLAGMSDRRRERAAANGGGADLCAALCAVHAGGDCRGG